MTGLVAPVALSAWVGALATALGFPLAAALGLWLARTRSPWRAAVSTVVFLPLVLPPVVTGWLLLAALGGGSSLGDALARVGLPVPFTVGAAVIAALVVGLPLYVMAARAAFEAVDRRYEELALTLGQTPRETFWRVTLPLAAPGLAGGAVLAFARALGEFGATIVLAGNTPRTQTIAVAVYGLLDAPDGETRVVPLVLASIALGVLALAAYEALVRRQRRRLEIDR